MDKYNPKEKYEMENEEAINFVVRKFPFKEYTCPRGEIKLSYYTVANVVRQYLPHGSKILDFGCGPCDKTSILQFMGYQCSGYDDLQDDWHKIPGNREKILSYAKEVGIDFYLANNENLPFKKNVYDMVVLHDVLEHLHDSPRDLLNDLLELVKPEGFIFITVPNLVNIRKRIDVLFGKTNLPRFEGYYWYPGPWRGHIREYVRDDLEKLANYLNLEVVELRSVDHMLEKLPIAARPLYLFATRIFKGWKDSWLLVAKKRPEWMPKKTIPRDQLSQILGKSTSYQYNE